MSSLLTNVFLDVMNTKYRGKPLRIRDLRCKLPLEETRDGGTRLVLHDAEGNDVYRLTVSPDDDPQNPRTDWDQITRMFCWHRNYAMGDPSPNHSRQSFRCWEWDDRFKDADQIIAEFGPGVVRPLYLMDHSVISISTGPFNCPWDSGQVGWIYISYDAANKLLVDKPLKNPERSKTLHKKILKCFDCDVQVYDQYLRNDVWQYLVEACEPCHLCRHVDWTTVDSCCGIYGFDDCLSEALTVLRNLVETSLANRGDLLQNNP